MAQASGKNEQAAPTGQKQPESGFRLSEAKGERPGSEEALESKPRFLAPHYRGASKLQDKVALITGGDPGIRRSVAILYASEGADFSIVFHK